MASHTVERLSTLLEVAENANRPDLVSLCARLVRTLERTVLNRLRDTAPLFEHCSHSGALGPCLPRVRDGRCIWCERPMTPAEQAAAYPAERVRQLGGGK